MSEQKYHIVGEGATPAEKDPNLHDCEFLWVENTFREARGEGRIFIYRDMGNQAWNIKVGLEFFTVNYCPYCGQPIWEETK